MVGTDQVAPTLTQLSVVKVWRGNESKGGCSPDCGYSGGIAIRPVVSDDITPTKSIGYRMSVVAGKPPGYLNLPPEPILAGTVFLDSGDDIELAWLGDPDEPLDFTLSIVAIDLAGNESPPQMLRVADSSSGCSVAARSRSQTVPVLASALFAVATLMARRRRRIPN
jgi:hypothetical protein